MSELFFPELAPLFSLENIRTLMSGFSTYLCDPGHTGRVRSGPVDVIYDHSKNLVWVKQRDYAISRTNPILLLMFLVRVVMIW